MSWSTYLQRLLAANPLLETPEARVTITSESLLRQLEKSYRQGVTDVLHDGQECGGSSATPDFLRDLFGKFQ